MTVFLPLPPLLSLKSRPSWVNRASRIDRSACVELRASDVRRHATFPTPGAPGFPGFPQARTTRGRYGARNPDIVRGFREAETEINIRARFLARLMRKDLPQQLQGDRRTTKANVMRPSCQQSAVQDQRATRRHARVHLSGPAANPNKGAPQTKMLGLWEGWSQTVTIERWRLHDRLAQHFLICPNCDHKFRKLFMPLCTKVEAIDADVAEAWISQLDTRAKLKRTPLPPSLMADRALLVNRYGPLFRAARRLVCRHCLGLRYGQVRKQPS